MQEEKSVNPINKSIDHRNLEDNKIALLQNSLEKNGKKYLTIAAVVVVVIVGIIFINNYIQESNLKAAEQASMALSRVNGFYASGDYDRALNGEPSALVRGEKIIGLKEIVSLYSGTEQALIAALYAGNALLAKNQFSDAQKYFETALESNSKIVQLGAITGIGTVKQENKNYKEAAEQFLKASEIADSDAMISKLTYMAGRAYELAGDKTSAENNYRKVLDISKFTEFANYSKVGLTRLGTIIE